MQNFKFSCFLKYTFHLWQNFLPCFSMKWTNPNLPAVWIGIFYEYLHIKNHYFIHLTCKYIGFILSNANIDRWIPKTVNAYKKEIDLVVKFANLIHICQISLYHLSKSWNIISIIFHWFELKMCCISSIFG